MEDQTIATDVWVVFIQSKITMILHVLKFYKGCEGSEDSRSIAITFLTTELEWFMPSHIVCFPHNLYSTCITHSSLPLHYSLTELTIQITFTIHLSSVLHDNPNSYSIRTF